MNKQKLGLLNQIKRKVKLDTKKQSVGTSKSALTKEDLKKLEVKPGGPPSSGFK